jgi:hypothetical protein
MLAGMATKGGEIVNQSGLVSGFMEGWKKSKGTEAIVKIIKTISEFLIKSVVGAVGEIIKTDPIGSAVLATVFLSPVRGAMLDLMKFLGGKVAASLAPSLMGSLGMGGGAASAAAAGGGGLAGAGATAAGWLGAIGPVLALIAKLLPPIALTLGAIVLLGGGVDNSLRQLGQIAGEVGNALGGSFGALGEVVGTVFALIGDLGSGLGRLLGALGGEGVAGQLDLLKVALFPITGLFQALEMGLRGISLALLTVREWLTNWLGSAEDKKKVQEERQAANLRAREAAGRQNAYNISMRGPEVLAQEMNKALYELNKSKTLKADRSAELKAFVAEARAQLSQQPKPTSTPTPAKPASTPQPTSLKTPAAPVSTASLAPLQAAVSAGTTATQGVKTAVAAGTSATQGVKTLVATGTAATQKAAEASQGTRQAVTQGASSIGGKLDSLNSGVNGVKTAISSIKIPPPQVLKVAPGSKVTAEAKGSSNPYTGGLGSAINYEMKNKPSGSHLVIANSSETVIPAAGGLGMRDLLGTLQQGFNNSRTAYESISEGVNKNRDDMKGGFAKVDKYQMTTSNQVSGLTQNMTGLAAQVKQLASFNAMGGGIAGGAGGAMGGTGTGSGYGGAGSKIAGALGTYIKQTGGAPGSIHEHPQHGGVKGKHSPNSYHYQGRAIDIGAYANEQAGVMARIAQFNAKNGVKPVEWLHAKNAGGHNDHVHVAYAFGQGNPALFSSKQAAQKFEKSMVPSSVRVGSITGNSAEGFGGGSTNVTNNITINQQPGQDADQLAMIVATKISEAVSDARAASILV